jgi:PAS domain S-box-containing protein
VTDHSKKKKELIDELTELRQKVSALEKSERERSRGDSPSGPGEDMFRRMADNARDMLFRISLPAGNYEYVSPSAMELTGYGPDEFYKNSVLVRSLVHPDWSQYFAVQWEKLLAGDMPPFYEFKIIHASGEERWVNQRNVLIRGSDGRPVAMEGIVTDISERKKTEDALKQAERKYRNIFENAVMGIFQRTPGEVFLSANRALVRMYGYDSLEELLRTVTDIGEQLYVNPSDRDRLAKLYEERGSVSDFEAQMYRRDGSRFWISMNARAVMDDEGNAVLYEGTAEDITERKEAEKALRESEETLKILINATQETLLLIDTKGTVLTINEVAAQRLGGSSRELTGRCLYDYFPPELVTNRKARFDEVMRTGVPARFKDEREGRHFEVFADPAFDREGKVSGIAVFAMEITERERMEKALRESENKFRDLAEKSAVGIYLIQDGLFRYVNKKFAEMKGYAVEEIIHIKGPKDTVFPEDLPLVQETVRKTILGEAEPPSFEFREVTKDHKIRIVETHVTRTMYKGKPAVIGTVTDITTRKQMEAEILKMRNLESIGILAGGIAHDFNNLLMIVSGYVSLAALSLSPDEEAYTYLRQAEQGFRGGKELTHKLLTFASGGEPIEQVLRVNDLLRTVSMPVLVGTGIKCEYLLSDDLFLLWADEAQLKQVVNNIVQNARESMSDGGTITIRSANTTLVPNDRIPLPPGDYVKLSIEDQGVGIQEKNLPRIFDPYFTTKNRCTDKGMGLGLTVAYSIIQRHKGYITVESVPGRHTVVDIYLPAYAQQEETTFLAETVPEPKGMVLFMDDEDHIRNIAKKFIVRLGYTVALAKDGSEAIMLYRDRLNSGKPFDAVILDLTVREGMGGQETFAELRSIDPDICAIISSGYTDSHIMSNYSDYGFKGVLKKPYAIQSIDEALRRLIR